MRKTGTTSSSTRGVPTRPAATAVAEDRAVAKVPKQANAAPSPDRVLSTLSKAGKPMHVGQLATLLIGHNEAAKVPPAFFKRLRAMLHQLRQEGKVVEDHHRRWALAVATAAAAQSTAAVPSSAAAAPPLTALPTPAETTVTVLITPPPPPPPEAEAERPVSRPSAQPTPFNSPLPNNRSLARDEKSLTCFPSDVPPHQLAQYAYLPPATPAYGPYAGGPPQQMVQPPPLPQNPPYIVTVIDAVSYHEALRVVPTNCVCLRRFIFTPPTLLVHASSEVDVIDVVQVAKTGPVTAAFRMLSTLINFAQCNQLITVSVVNVFSRDPLAHYLVEELAPYGLQIEIITEL